MRAGEQLGIDLVNMPKDPPGSLPFLSTNTNQEQLCLCINTSLTFLPANSPVPKYIHPGFDEPNLTYTRHTLLKVNYTASTVRESNYIRSTIRKSTEYARPKYIYIRPINHVST